MRGRLLTALVATLLLGAVSAALAASSPPVAGGHYRGSTTFRSTFPAKHGVSLAVTRSRANFASGRFEFVLNGTGGLGSCAGPTYVTLSPTHSRQISRGGTFDLRGRFTLTIPTPYGSVNYLTTVLIKGAFSGHGRRVAGSVAETAAGKHLTCHSGVVGFSARLAG